MKDFAFARADSEASALSLIARNANAKFLAGGTNLVDLMREQIETPDALIDISGLPYNSIDELPDGGLRIGALVRNTQLAAHSLVRERYPMLSQAVLMGASAQLRNVATTAGNLMQRTRCHYFYDNTTRCNKRQPGAGCDALEGFNRNHAILGTSLACVATHPSDLCVALAALDAVVRVKGEGEERSIPLCDFHRLPGEAPHLETNLRAHELITSVDLPPLPAARRSLYRKVRDRASFAFALVSVAAAVEIEEGVIAQVRIAFGGVAPKPWRAFAAEQYLLGKPCDRQTIREAAALEFEPAIALPDNGFKITLAQQTLLGALIELSEHKETA